MVDWFVLLPFLSGPASAIIKNPQGTAAFAHRDLRVVWELYAKTPRDDRQSPVDLVDFVQNMTKQLLSAEAVWAYHFKPPDGDKD